MNGEQIEKIMVEEMGNMFLGVFPKNRLPKSPVPIPSCCIANTDPEGKPGQHWVGFFINDSNEGEFFDSYGLPPTLFPEFHRFLTLNCPNSFTWNDKTLQGIGSLSCGQYCVFYLFHRWKNIPMNTILGAFCTDKAANDCLVADWINERYDLDTQCHMGDKTQTCIAKNL
jgi:hypothetical protein